MPGLSERAVMSDRSHPGVDQFDRLYQESLEQPRIMSMSIHPYIMGVPHRIKHFEAAYEHMLQHDDVWFATGEELYDWYMAG